MKRLLALVTAALECEHATTLTVPGHDTGRHVKVCTWCGAWKTHPNSTWERPAIYSHVEIAATEELPRVNEALSHVGALTSPILGLRESPVGGTPEFLALEDLFVPEKASAVMRAVAAKTDPAPPFEGTGS